MVFSLEVVSGDERGQAEGALIGQRGGGKTKDVSMKNIGVRY